MSLALSETQKTGFSRQSPYDNYKFKKKEIKSALFYMILFLNHEFHLSYLYDDVKIQTPVSKICSYFIFYICYKLFLLFMCLNYFAILFFKKCI